jgi:hypothetical protein
MALNIFGQPPEYLSGLLGVDPEKLRKQATTTGLINTALAFAAQPRNQQYGSVLPYAARALMAGQQGAQGVYQGALQDYQTRQQIEEAKRKQEQQMQRQSAIQQFGTQNPSLAAAAQAFPEQVIPQAALKSLETQKRETFVAPDGSIRFKDTGEVAQKDIVRAPEKRETVIAPNGMLIYKDTGQPVTQRSFAAPKEPSKPNYKVETDANGKVVFIPQQPGMPVVDIAGKPTTYTPKETIKAPTAEESKAAGFYGRMTLASEKLNAPVLGSDKKPILNEDGTPATLEQIAGKPRKFLGDTRFSNENRKLYKQAAENWVRANLRKESGAVIGEQEMEAEVENYFPNAWDTPAVVAQKAQFRKQAEEAMKLSAGKSLGQKASGEWSIEEVK